MRAHWRWAALASIALATSAVQAVSAAPTPSPLLLGNSLHQTPATTTAPVAAPAPGPAVVLAGSNSIVVAKAARIPVRVPRSVNVAGDCLSRNAPGTGLLAMLVPTGSTAGTPIDFGVLPRELGGRSYSVACSGPTLAKGTYNLYVTPLSRPGILTLRLPGLRGTAVVRPTQHVASRAMLLPLTSPAQAEPLTYTWGTAGQLKGPGLIYDAIWASAPIGASSVVGDCIYQGTPPGGVYTTGCPGADYTATSPYDGHVQPAEYYLASSTSILPGATYGVGGYIAGVNASPEAGELAWWLTY